MGNTMLRADLERENADLRRLVALLRDGIASVAGELLDAWAALDAAQADTRRLDWVDAGGLFSYAPGKVREGIDTAMKGEGDSDG